MAFTTLITVSELKSFLDEPGLQVFDCRFSLADAGAGRKAYQQAHIPGACFADMNHDLSSPHIPGVTGRHPLPAKDEWLKKVQQWGIDRNTQVVLYDDAGGAGAARMWWMLRWLGHGKVAVLDGGWPAWLAVGEDAVETAIPSSPKRASDDYSDCPPLTRLYEAEQIASEKQVLLDARDEARYRGEVEPIDPVAGHIPGARCFPFTSNLEEGGHFKSKQQLAERFSNLAGDVVSYCGSGVTACHNILAMVHAGLPEPALYAGSWSEWITDPSRKIEP